MADAVEVAIESALINRLLALAFSPAITVSLPNVGDEDGDGPFVPPIAEPTACWLRATFLPANTFALGVSDSSANQHVGIFQVDVFYGQGSGELAPGRIATDIIQWFKRGTTLSKDGFDVQIIQPPKRMRIIRDDPWIMLPVSIAYIAFASNPA